MAGYLRRFPGIRTIMVDKLCPRDDHQANSLAALRDAGLRIVELVRYREGMAA